jgi:hypothetical protein
MTRRMKKHRSHTVNGCKQLMIAWIKKWMKRAYTNPSIQALFNVIEKDKITLFERARMKEEDNQAQAETQAFKEGEEKGWKAGIKKTARNIKANGKLTEEEIASITGLTLEIVKAL